MLRRSVVALLVSTLVPMAWVTQATGEITPALGRYIVVFNSPVAPGSTVEAATGLGATVNGVFRSLNGLLVTLPLLNLGSLLDDPRVAYVAPDRPVRLLAEEAPAGVSRIGAAPEVAPDGSVLRAADPQSAVAIVDTGISPHPDLNVVGGVNCSSGFLGGLLGGLLGGGGSEADENGDYTDSHGHGTHVAGTVGGRLGSGAVGVSPGAPLYAVKVFGSLGSGSLSDVICGLDWVAANAAEKNIKVLNLSLGGEGIDDAACGAKSEDPFHDAICRVVAAGVTVVAAAGNSKVDLVESVPAAYDEVLTVTAMADYDGLPGGEAGPTCLTKDVDDTAADFSNFTLPDSPDAAHTVAAPGVCVHSTWNDGGYNVISGTSMAAPHVSGLVARCIDAGPCAGMSPAEIIGKVRADASVRPAGTGFFGDPTMPLEGRYYGDLVDSSGY